MENKNNKKKLESLLLDIYDNDEFILGIENLVCDNPIKLTKLIRYIELNANVTSDHISQYALRLDIEYNNSSLKQLLS